MQVELAWQGSCRRWERKQEQFTPEEGATNVLDRKKRMWDSAVNLLGWECRVSSGIYRVAKWVTGNPHDNVRVGRGSVLLLKEQTSPPNERERAWCVISANTDDDLTSLTVFVDVDFLR